MPGKRSIYPELYMSPGFWSSKRSETYPKEKYSNSQFFLVNILSLVSAGNFYFFRNFERDEKPKRSTVPGSEWPRFGGGYY